MELLDVVPNDPEPNWVNNNSVYFRIGMAVLIVIFGGIFVWLIKDMYKMDTFFARFCKIWSVICLTLRLIYLIFAITYDLQHPNEED